MDRMEEYRNMMQEMKQTPPELETTAQRAIARAKRTRRWRVPTSLASAAAMLAVAFVLTVNLFVNVGAAMGRMPILGDIVRAVAINPSLKMAVEHGHVQEVHETQERDGYRVQLEYVIADKRNLTAFLRITDVAQGQETTVEGVALYDQDGTDFSASGGYGGPPTDDGLHEVNFNLSDNQVMPQNVVLTVDVARRPPWGEGPELAPEQEEWEVVELERLPTQTFTFALTLDEQFFQAGKTMEINREIQVEEQRIIVESMEIYPTQVRIVYREAEDNPDLLESVPFQLVDEYGNVWEQKRNGIIAVGTQGGEKRECWLESSYFSPAKHFTLRLKQYTLVPKEEQYVYVDAQAGTAGPLPDFIQLDSMEKKGSHLKLAFRVHTWKAGHMFGVFSNSYLDDAGQERFINAVSSRIVTNQEGWYIEEFWVGGWENGPIRLERYMGELHVLEKPIKVPLS